MALSPWEGSLPGEVGVERAAGYVPLILQCPLYSCMAGLVTCGRAKEGSSYVFGSWGSILPLDILGVDHVNTVGSRCYSQATEKGS